MDSVFTNGIVTQMISLFEYAYRKGVIDAAELRDDFLCTDFIRKRQDPNFFGVLDRPYDMDWAEWKFHLSRWCDAARLLKLKDVYLNQIHKHSHYYAAMLSITQDFYIMGVKEWMEYPNPMQLSIFKDRKRVFWAPVNGNTMTSMSRERIITYVQEFIFERTHREEGVKDPLTPLCYKLFGTEFWKLSRSSNNRSKAR